MTDPSDRNSAQRPAPSPLLPPLVHVREEQALEYRRLARDLEKEEAPTAAELDELGEDGWELTGIFTNPPFVYFYFKRLKV